VKAVPAGAALTLTPDPATGSSTIRWVSAGSSNVTITLFDMSGHAVLRRQYALKTGVNELLVTKLETLSAGLYFVQGYDGSGYKNGKLLIQH
jgi:hypothetical protein